MSPSRKLILALCVAAGALVLVTLVTAPTQAQGKPAYDPEVEAVARTIFLELMSPY